MTVSGPNEISSCPNCHTPVPRSSPEGLCPLCLAFLITDGPEAATNSPEQFQDQQFFGDYELLEEVGRGGSGIVFKARQLGVNRVVALKLLSGGASAGRDFIHRFHIEAAAAAQLEHPNIVPIYDFGAHEGAHYLSMRFLEGGTLQALVARQRVTPWQAASLTIEIAAAVEHAHRCGVLHRDLKPGNILLDGSGIPYITDFGLARLIEQESSLTLSHLVLGTVAYVAPEVARFGAARATTASDIYAVGAILYELLTCRPPFASGSIAATLRAIELSDPPKPRTLNQHIPADLETICLKCLEKVPDKRYLTAQALGEDLKRLLNNEPISARPITRLARVVRWSQRNPALAAAYSILAILLLLILIGSPLAAFRFNRAREAETFQRHIAERSLYASDMLLTQAALEQDRTADAIRFLGKYNQFPTNDGISNSSLFLASPSIEPGWEWRYYLKQTKGQELFTLGQHASNNVVAAGFLPDGDKAWSAGLDGLVHIWSVPTRQKIATFRHDQPIFDAAHSPDGRWLVTICGSGLIPGNHPMRLWDLTTGTVKSILSTNRFPRKMTRFSPDSRWIAYEEVGDGIHIMDIATREEVAFLPGFMEKIWPLGFDFAPNKPLLAYCPGRSGAIHLRNYSANTNLATLSGHTDVVLSISFSPDGKRLASTSVDRTVRIWEVATAKELAKALLPPEADNPWAITFSPDGGLIGFLDDTEVINLFHSHNATPYRRLRGNRGFANSLAFSPDGMTLLSTGSDDKVRVWARDAEPESKTAQALPSGLFVAQNRSQLFSLSPGGNFLLTTFTNGTCSIWNTHSFQESSRYLMPGTNLLQETISPDGKLVALAFATNGTTLVLWNAESEQIRWVRHYPPPISVGRLAISPDGKYLAFPGWPLLRVLGTADGTEYRTFSYGETYAFDLAGATSFSSDSTQVSLANHSGWALVWDLAHNRLRGKDYTQGSILASVAFSPDANSLFIGGFGIKAFDLNEGKFSSDFNPAPVNVLAIAVSKDGRTLGISEGRTITLWSFDFHHPVGRLRGHRQEITALAFREDDALVSVSYDEMRVWPTSSEDRQKQ